MEPELHLFIVWDKARHAEERILADLEATFEVLRVLEVSWSPARFSRNLSRFYGQKLPKGSGKERHCGTGAFLLALVRDPRPRYEDRETSKGVARVNVNPFDAKTRYRDWTGGGHRIHGTNTPEETEHDAMLLLGERPEALAAKAGGWDGKIDAIARDVTGADGWENLTELLDVLDATTRYVVLRNFDPLPDDYYAGTHGDIDLLTDDAVELAYVANAERVFRQRYRVHYHVRIGDDDVAFDFRHVGDGYMDEGWERGVLDRRVRSGRGFWIPSDEDHFHSLLYHALVHKPEVSDDYAETLARLAAELGIGGSPAMFRDPNAARVPLESYFARMGYRFSEPEDLSVFFNSALVGGAPSVRRRAFRTVKDTVRGVKGMFR